jgi:hypothetical protein
MYIHTHTHTSIHICRARMLTYSHVCSRMLTHADANVPRICRTLRNHVNNLLVKETDSYAHVCSRMLTYADVC